MGFSRAEMEKARVGVGGARVEMGRARTEMEISRAKMVIVRAGVEKSRVGMDTARAGVDILRVGTETSRVGADALLAGTDLFAATDGALVAPIPSSHCQRRIEVLAIVQVALATARMTVEWRAEGLDQLPGRRASLSSGVFPAIFQGIVGKWRGGVADSFEVSIDLDQDQLVSRNVAEVGRHGLEDGEHFVFIQGVIQAAEGRLIEEELLRGNEVSVDLVGNLVNAFPRSTGLL